MKVLMLALAVLMAVSLVGCGSSGDCGDVENENANLKQENASLKAQVDSASDANGSVSAALESLQAEYDAISAEFTALEVDCQNLKKGLATSDLENPTWDDLRSFLVMDDTDSIEYITDEFDCEGFTVTLRTQARRRGFRSAYIAIGFAEGTTGHALTAFETADKGLVYVDDTSRDAIAYVESEKVYGAIPLDGVRDEYILCSGASNEFWRQPLTKAQYTGSLFEYDYYEGYARRAQFYRESVSAYNSDVENYNAAVLAFNAGTGTDSRSDIDAWAGRLGDWSENLEALDADLGGLRIEPMGVVDTIESYWN